MFPLRLFQTSNGGVVRPGNWQYAFFLLLAAATFLAYQPAWTGRPIWDDDAHLTRPELRSVEGLGRIWADPRATIQYYPLLHTVFWIEQKVWGDSTLGYHMVNLLLHICVAWLFFKLLQRLAVPGAWLAAALFALHPVEVESVAWITELKNTLSTLFYLSAAWHYLNFDASRSRKSYSLALLLFLAALMTKTVTGTFPAAMLVIFWWQRGRLSLKGDVLPLLPFFAVGIGGGMVTAWWELEVNRCHGPMFDLSMADRFLVAGRAVWFHLGKLFWPAGLTFSYPRWQIHSGQWTQYLYPIEVILLLLLLWKFRNWSRGPLAAFLLYLGTLFPTLGFFNLYTFRYSYVADHYQYAASMAVIALVAVGIVRYPGKAFSLVLLAVLAGLTWRQAHIYADSKALWSDTLQKDPCCWMAHNNVGQMLAAEGQLDLALPHFQEALRLQPEAAEVENNFGRALMLQGNPQAEERFQAALRLDPQFRDAHVNYANLLFKCGRIEQAISHYRDALKCGAHDYALHNNLGSALNQVGRCDEAIEHFQKALELKPDCVQAWLNLGGARKAQGKLDQAIEAFRGALRYQANPGAMDSLASACAEARRYSEAAEAMQQAVALAESAGQTAVAAEFRARAKAYRGQAQAR